MKWDVPFDQAAHDGGLTGRKSRPPKTLGSLHRSFASNAQYVDATIGDYSLSL